MWTRCRESGAQDGGGERESPPGSGGREGRRVLSPLLALVATSGLLVQLVPLGNLPVLRAIIGISWCLGCTAWLAILMNELAVARAVRPHEERDSRAAPPELDVKPCHSPAGEALQTEKLAALGTMVAGVAHELANPLTAVCGFSELVLEDCTLAPGTRERFEVLRTHADRCRRIVENLLRYARHLEPERTRVQVNRILADALELVAGPLKVARVTLVRDLDPCLPEVFADPSQLLQVVINILANALQAMHGRPSGVIRVQTGLSPRGAVVTRVSDNGLGMNPAVLSRIFDPFFTTKQSRGGTGLGLSLSRELVQQNGGRLWAESEEGKGATFTIELPPAQCETTGPETASPAGMPCLRVLVVDDEPAIGELLTQLLVSDGHEVQHCCDGLEAVDLLQRESFDVILSDLCMPGMDGEELHALLCEEHPDQARRMAFVTGDVLNDSIVRLSRETGRPLVTKPFRRDAIRETLRALAGVPAAID
ncbi:MAG: ATP-binding protein [Planctomycetota bacterium]